MIGPTNVFRVVSVASLPRTSLLPRRAEDEHLPDACVRTISPWRRRYRQAVPLRGGRDCCWYHGGDWHVASSLAVRLLREAARGGEADQDELGYQVVTAGRTVDLPGWERKAFESLLNDPICLEDGEYINGRHRASAMMAAGVRATVVQVVLWEE
ncbi:hypothetical protein ACG83_10270 [Frankia sp. R43]|nr:hypothetical protein ACG83_10270 [Frankia sp. R43]